MPSPTPAGQTPYTVNNPVGPVRLDWFFLLGDTWSSEQMAVLIDNAPVDLTAPGWVVTAQARRYADSDTVLAEWSTRHTTAAQGGRIRIATAEIALGEATVETSTVQLFHGPESRQRWAPFDRALIEVEVTLRPVPDPDPVADPVENYTIGRGQVTAELDVNR